MRNTSRQWRKYHTLWLLLLIITIALGSATFYFMWQDYRKPEERRYYGMRINPTVTPLVTPVPTTPVPTIDDPLYKDVSSLSGKILYSYHKTIFASDYDGNNAFKLVNLAGDVGLAGWKGNNVIYYYAPINKEESALIQKDLSTQILTTLFTFNTGVYDGQRHIGNAAVTKDGRYVVYENNAGTISLFDIFNHTNRILLTSGSCIGPDGKENSASPSCYSYGSPQWAPDDRTVILIESHYESQWYDSFNPFTDTVPHSFAYAPHENQLNITKDTYFSLRLGYGNSSLYAINDLSNPRAVDVLQIIDSDSFHELYSTDVASDGRIAFVNASIYPKKPEISIINPADYSMHTVASLQDGSYVLKWLPDNKTLLYTDSNKQVWSLDTKTLKKTPLNILADTIYGYVE